MPTKILPSIEKAHYIFILWGDRFDEDVATIFTIEARRIGLCVKIVGITGVQAAGGNGLILTADLTLSQAMTHASNAICVVIPCSPATLQRVEDDPRLAEFFQEANTNRALFVVSSHDAVVRSSIHALYRSISHISYYRDYRNLIENTQEIMSTLSGVLAMS